MEVISVTNYLYKFLWINIFILFKSVTEVAKVWLYIHNNDLHLKGNNYKSLRSVVSGFIYMNWMDWILSFVQKYVVRAYYFLVQYMQIYWPLEIVKNSHDLLVIWTYIFFQVLGGFDSSNYVSERKWAAAFDGTQIPISIIYRKDLVQLDGSDPMLLSGFGSYEVLGCNLCWSEKNVSAIRNIVNYFLEQPVIHASIAGPSRMQMSHLECSSTFSLVIQKLRGFCTWMPWNFSRMPCGSHQHLCFIMDANYCFQTNVFLCTSAGNTNFFANMASCFHAHYFIWMWLSSKVPHFFFAGKVPHSFISLHTLHRIYKHMKLKHYSKPEGKRQKYKFSSACMKGWLCYFLKLRTINAKVEV